LAVAGAALPATHRGNDNGGVNVTLIPANEYRRERWKNGLGWTREIARWPVGSPDWDWRVSIAEIDGDARFSVFDGIERELVLLSGEGMRLHFDNQDEAVELLPPHGRVRFDGARAARAELLSGPTTDYNLMWRRERVDATLLHRPLVGPMLFFAEPGVQWLATLIGGRALVKDDLLPLHLAQGDSLLIGERSEGRVILEGGGELLLARIAITGPRGGQG
jgi:environmental stress-induced protein Ves